VQQKSREKISKLISFRRGGREKDRAERERENEQKREKERATT